MRLLRSLPHAAMRWLAFALCLHALGWLALAWRPRLGWWPPEALGPMLWVLAVAALLAGLWRWWPQLG